MRLTSTAVTLQIGRTNPADIVVPIPTVSTRHAVVRVTDATGAAAGSVQARPGGVHSNCEKEGRRLLVHALA